MHSEAVGDVEAPWYRPLEARSQRRTPRRLVPLLGWFASGVAALDLVACVGYRSEPLEFEGVLRALAVRVEHGVQIQGHAALQDEWFPLEADVRIDDGLSLGEMNSLALFFSPSLRVARVDARIVGAQVLGAGVLANPQLFLGPRISTRDSQVIFPASLSWQVPLWGIPGARREVAELRLTGGTLRLVELELDTLRRVRVALIRLWRLRREEALQEVLAQSAREIVAWTERLRRSGEVDAVTSYLAGVERYEAETRLGNLQNEATIARSEVLEMLGLLPDAPVELILDDAVRVPPLPASNRESLQRLPALRAAEAAYELADAELRLEVRRQYPSIRLGAEFEDDRGDPTIGPGVGLEIPLFDRNRGGIAAAEETRLRAREIYQNAVLGAAHEASRARSELRASEEVLTYFEQGALVSVDAASRALDARLRTGRAEVTEVLAAQRAIGRSRARVLQLEERVATARWNAAVLGGLAVRSPDSVETTSGELNSGGTDE